MAHVTMMTGPERRRHWTRDERRKILEASFAPGAIVASVARHYEVSTSLIYKWRREVKAIRSEPAFIPAMIVDGAASADAHTGPQAAIQAAIIVELSGGGRVLIDARASAAIVCAALKALRS